ncbi:CPXCG motif-containing cysteine-rich protein [Planctomicrobium sp. SH527]|uniref:CPXCG motif-containing cysteine-rich protein n=1 Tax=Planctomicrobium sp. SH527 TaxID=3448123 RepID=UPI003F5B3A3A
MNDEAEYVCPYCGEEIIVPVDLTQGEHQEYVEDCPVCCSPVVIRLEIQEDGGFSCSASPEF